MAEAIPYGIISNILSKLAWLVGEEPGLASWWDEELQKLWETLATIDCVLLDAEQMQESNRAFKNCISRLVDVVYDADDLPDEVDYEIQDQKVHARGKVSEVHVWEHVRNFFSPSNPLFIGLNMGHRIKEIRGWLDTVAADMSKFYLRERVGELDKKAKDTGRETASKVRSELIIGREKDKELIIELIIESLLKKQNDQHGDIIPIVAIVGFGGLGKTSLAQLVYGDAKVKSCFDQQIWVCVSEDFNRCMIFKEILKSLDNLVKMDNLNLDQVLTELEEKLRGKRYLLVLDDVWNENNLEWEDFSKYLVCFGAPGSKILVTARSKIVASAMGVQYLYHLEGLNEDQSWTLFKQVAFKGQGQIDTDLRVIGEDVARRCKGVPRALKYLGGLMRLKPNKNYRSSVQENRIWKSLEKDGNTSLVLRLSYDHLPSHPKQCFLTFCSPFPEDFKISTDNLIQLWRAQSYIQLEENENIQDIGDEYFNDLSLRSFFQKEEKDMYGNIICCNMHDVICDLMKDEKERLLKEFDMCH
ncbi:NB-ARC - like 1 [Theobroma cacao]|nr:NB-ARC - like 1 [Theobroma cacao]